MKLRTRIMQFGNSTGIEVTEQFWEIRWPKKPLVVVTLNNHCYRSAVGKMGDKFLISLSAENRKKANVNGGDEAEINIELDTEPRIVELPLDLEKALDKNETAKAAFEKLAPSKKKAMVLSIVGAKSDRIKQNRIEKAIASLMDRLKI